MPKEMPEVEERELEPVAISADVLEARCTSSA
jgi:hypothetical protein